MKLARPWEFDGNLVEDRIKKVDASDNFSVHIGPEKKIEFNLFNLHEKLDGLASLGPYHLIISSFEINRKIITTSLDTDFNHHWECYRKLNRYYKDKDIFWYDHCVANRAYFISTLLSIFDGSISLKDSYSQALADLKLCLDWLSDKKNYNFFSNHGLITDLYGSLACTNLTSEKYFKNRLDDFVNRAINRVDHFISDDGVPLESSTSYWFLIHSMYSILCDISDSFEICSTEKCRNKLIKFENLVSQHKIDKRMCRIGVSVDVKPHILEDFPEVNVPNNWENTLKVDIYDTGLVFFNFFGPHGFRQQFLFNCQNIRGDFLNYPECLAVYHMDSNVTWINPPGSIKTIFSDQHNYAISFKNQSIPVADSIGYRGNNLPELYIYSKQDEEITVIGKLAMGLGVYITREIKICKGSSEFVIKDYINRGDLSSQFLLNQDAKVLIGEKQSRVVANDHVLNISHPLGKPELRNGYIQLDRKEQLTESKMILFTNAKNIIQFKLCGNINRILANTPKNLPYRGRKNKWPIRKKFTRLKRDLQVYKNIVCS